MRKIIPLMIILLLFGCEKKENTEEVKSIIEHNQNTIISIHYPITQIKSIDRVLEKDTFKILQEFKNTYDSFYTLNQPAELNIDYTKKEINNRYLNLTLSIFIDSPTLAHPENYLKTYVYDKKEQKFLTMEDLITKENLKILASKLQIQLLNQYKDCLFLEEMKTKINDDFQNYTLFTFDDTYLTIYKNPYEVASGNCKIITLSIPISELELKIPLTKETFIEKNVSTPAPQTKVIDPTKPVLALTFDDGPSIYTKEIIDFLKSQNANATFFVIGNKVELYQEIIKESIQNGNEIGNHSYNHKNLAKLSLEELKDQIDKTQEIIKKTTGYTPRLLRPTYGEKNQKIIQHTNLKVVLWDIDPKDWGQKKTKEEIVKHILSKVTNKDIILLHDTKKKTVEVVKLIVPKLIEQGYQFITVSELEEVKLLNQQ